MLERTARMVLILSVLAACGARNYVVTCLGSRIAPNGGALVALRSKMWPCGAPAQSAILSLDDGLTSQIRARCALRLHLMRTFFLLLQCFVRRAAKMRSRRGPQLRRLRDKS